MKRYTITLGARTTAGGTVISASSPMKINGMQVALIGDKVSCPSCKRTGVITLSGDRLKFFDCSKGAPKEIALEDDLCFCGCRPYPRMVPIQNIHCCTIKKTDKIALRLQNTHYSTIKKTDEVALHLPDKAKGFAAADLPPVPQPVVDAVTGFGSAISFGLTDLINKKLGTDSAYNSNSTASQIGETIGAVIGPRKIKSIVTKGSDLIVKQASKIANFIKSSVPGAVTKGRAKQYDKSGGYNQAIKDFNDLALKDVKNIPNGKVGKLEDGRMVNVRSKSSDGRPTLEIQNEKNAIKFRYDE